MARSRLASLFYSWWRAHTDTEFYQAVQIWTQRRVTLFLLGSYALLALAQMVATYALTLPRFAQGINQYWHEISPRFPENFRLEYSNRFLTLEPEKRLALPFPTFLKTENSPENILVIDTNTEVMPEKESTLIFSAYDEYVVQPSQPGRHPSALEFVFEKNSWTITRADIDREIQELQANWSQLRFFGSVGAGAAIILLLLPWRVLVLFLYAWIGQTILRLMGNRMGYWEAFRLGLIVLIPAETLLFLARVLYPQQLLFEFWVIWLALLMIIGFTNRKKL